MSDRETRAHRKVVEKFEAKEVTTEEEPNQELPHDEENDEDNDDA